MMNNQVDYFSYVNCFFKTEEIYSIPIKQCDIKISDITIAIPTYKRDGNLKEAVESSLNQMGFDETYQVLVVDNNPERNDETEKLILTYNDCRLSYYKNSENLGMFGNWNRLFTLAHSNYIVMLHDDDILSPFFLRDISRVLNMYPNASVIQAGKVKWNEKERCRPILFNDVKQYGIQRISLESQFYKFYFQAPTGTLFRRQDVIELGGFNSDFYPSSDYIFMCNMIQKKEVYFYKKPLLIYRVGVNTTSKIETQIKWLDIEWCFKQFLCKFVSLPEWFKQYVKYSNMIIRFKSIKERDSNFIYSINDEDLKYPSYTYRIFYKIFDKFLEWYWVNNGIINKL